MNLIELATAFKKARLERGMTLEEAASRAGLTRGWLSKVEHFRVTPSLPALASIASALGVRLSEFFEGIDAQPAFFVTRRGQGQMITRSSIFSMVRTSSASPTSA